MINIKMDRNVKSGIHENIQWKYDNIYAKSNDNELLQQQLIMQWNHVSILFAINSTRNKINCKAYQLGMTCTKYNEIIIINQIGENN